MLVVGAGAIGMEFASFYHALGVQVHVVEMADRVLPVEDAEVSDYIAQALRKQGMALHLGSGIASKQRHAGGWKIRSEEHTSELQSLMRISYAVFCLKKKTRK